MRTHPIGAGTAGAQQFVLPIAKSAQGGFRIGGIARECIEIKSADVLEIVRHECGPCLIGLGLHRHQQVGGAGVRHRAGDGQGVVVIADGIRLMVHVVIGGGIIPLKVEVQHVPLAGGGQCRPRQQAHHGGGGRREADFLSHIGSPFRGDGVQRGVDPPFDRRRVGLGAGHAQGHHVVPQRLHPVSHASTPPFVRISRRAFRPRNSRCLAAAWERPSSRATSFSLSP